MIELGFTLSDAIRSGWTFAAAFVAVMAGYDGNLSKSAIWAAVAAGVVAVKNGLFKDGSRIKG